MAYHHFNREDRSLLARLKHRGFSTRKCAEALGFHPSTIYRELARGRAQNKIKYSSKASQRASKSKRLKANQQHRKLGKQQSSEITQMLREFYSPDQAGQALGLSHSTVYRWLWQQPKEQINLLRPYLRHKKLRRKYGTKRRERQRELLKKRWIDDRPEEVNSRSTFGHWEGDTVRGKNSKGHFVTLVERKSGYALVGHIPRATKEEFRVCAEELFSTIPPHLKKSLTLDNGVEMNDFEVLERRTGVQVYFAHPYHSWERGSNENFNGLLRQFYPKGSDLSEVAKKELDLAVNLLNTRPRKRHNYVSPKALLDPLMSVAV